MNNLISFVLKQLNIYNLSTLINKWNLVQDLFFYFNKVKGCSIPSFDECRSYVSKERSFIQYGVRSNYGSGR